MGEIEIWKDVIGYEGLYQVSDLGRIKSVERMVQGRVGLRVQKEIVMKCPIGDVGYYSVVLRKNSKSKGFRVHQLVAIAFLGHVPEKGLTVDHIDNDKLNNRKNNLQVITSRENNSKDRVNLSGYTGVSIDDRKRPYRARIRFKDKYIGLGSYYTPEEASSAYQYALKRIETGLHPKNN